jgi:hypothetical protein
VTLLAFAVGGRDLGPGWGTGPVTLAWAAVVIALVAYPAAPRRDTALGRSGGDGLEDADHVTVRADEGVEFHLHH